MIFIFQQIIFLFLRIKKKDLMRTFELWKHSLMCHSLIPPSFKYLANIFNSKNSRSSPQNMSSVYFALINFYRIRKLHYIVSNAKKSDHLHVHTHPPPQNHALLSKHLILYPGVHAKELANKATVYKVNRNSFLC